MHALTTQRRQTIAPLAQGVLRLAGLIPSPYMNEMSGIGTVRNTNIFLTYMKAIAGLDYGYSGTGYIGVGFYDGSTPVSADNITFDMAGASTNEEIIANAESAIQDYATGHSYDLTEGILWVPSLPAVLAGAPQAAIADAPADATTNYNVITTLLGSLTGAVNTANGKQNDIATKLNTLLAELRTLGLIAS